MPDSPTQPGLNRRYLRVQTNQIIALCVLLSSINACGTAPVQDSKMTPSVSLELKLGGPSGSDVAFNRDGSLLLVAGDEAVQVWDTTTWKSVGPLLIHGKGLLQAQMDAAGERVLTFGVDTMSQRLLDSRVKVWDVHTGQELYCSSTQDKAVWKAVLSPDGQHVATIDAVRHLRIVEVTTGEPSHDFFDDVLNAREVVFDHDGKSLIVVESNSVRVWDMQTKAWRSKFSIDSHAKSVGFANGRIFVQSSIVRVYDIVSGTLLLTRQTKNDQWWESTEIRISPDGARISMHVKDFEPTLAIDSEPDEIWNVDTGDRVMTEFSATVIFDPQSEAAYMHRSSETEDGIWDLTTGRCVRKLEKVASMSNVLFSPDGTKLIIPCGKYTKVLFAHPGIAGANRWKLQKAVMP